MIPVGSIWLERHSGRRVRITREAELPAWSYIDNHGELEPHGLEPTNGFIYADWFEHRSDAADFLVWGRFERIS